MSNTMKIMLFNFLENKKLANGLPSIAYTDEEFWQVECDTVLAENWVFVGFVHEFDRLGDVSPVSIAGKPILLVKNTKKETKLDYIGCTIILFFVYNTDFIKQRFVIDPIIKFST